MAFRAGVRSCGIVLCTLGLVFTSVACGTLTTNTRILSDTSHLGTVYSGSRQDLHGLVCIGQDIKQDMSGLIFLPVGALLLVDLPLSVVADTLLLPVDIPLEADRPPQPIAAGGCDLFGM